MLHCPGSIASRHGRRATVAIARKTGRFGTRLPGPSRQVSLSNNARPFLLQPALAVYGVHPRGTERYRGVPSGTEVYRVVPRGTEGYRWVPRGTEGYRHGVCASERT